MKSAIIIGIKGSESPRLENFYDFPRKFLFVIPFSLKMERDGPLFGKIRGTLKVGFVKKAAARFQISVSRIKREFEFLQNVLLKNREQWENL